MMISAISVNHIGGADTLKNISFHLYIPSLKINMFAGRGAPPLTPLVN